MFSMYIFNIEIKEIEYFILVQSISQILKVLIEFFFFSASLERREGKKANRCDCQSYFCILLNRAHIQTYNSIYFYAFAFFYSLREKKKERQRKRRDERSIEQISFFFFFLMIISLNLLWQLFFKTYLFG